MNLSSRDDVTFFFYPIFLVSSHALSFQSAWNSFAASIKNISSSEQIFFDIFYLYNEVQFDLAHNHSISLF